MGQRLMLRLAAILAVLLTAPGGISPALAQGPGGGADKTPVPAASLAGQVLVASPKLRDPFFARTVVFIFRHDADGAAGMIVNRRLGKGRLGDLLAELGFEANPKAGDIEVHFGGPVDPGKGFVLHTPEYVGKGTKMLGRRFALTADPAILQDIAAGRGPRRLLFAVGHAGWAPGQLESEFARGDWLSAEPDEALLFDTGPDIMWERARKSAGIAL